MTFGEKIKTLREEQGLSQSELANKMNITQQAIAKYEKTIDTPKLATVRKIATALNVALSELIDDWSVFSKDEMPKDLTDYGRGFYGKEAPKEIQEKFSKRFFEHKTEMTHDLDLLNETGHKKAADYIKDLTKIPEYRKNLEEW